MTIGRYILRGWAWQARAFASWDLANSGQVVTVANPTTRLAIVGTSRRRLAIEGTSAERLPTVGTSGKRITLIGSSE